MTRLRDYFGRLPGAVSGLAITLTGLVVCLAVCAAITILLTGVILVIQKIDPVGLMVGFLSVFVGFIVLAFATTAGLQLTPLCRISTLIVSVVSMIQYSCWNFYGY